MATKPETENGTKTDISKEANRENLVATARVLVQTGAWAWREGGITVSGLICLHVFEVANRKEGEPRDWRIRWANRAGGVAEQPLGDVDEVPDLTHPVNQGLLEALVRAKHGGGVYAAPVDHGQWRIMKSVLGEVRAFTGAYDTRAMAWAQALLLQRSLLDSLDWATLAPVEQLPLQVSLDDIYRKHWPGLKVEHPDGTFGRVVGQASLSEVLVEPEPTGVGPVDAHLWKLDDAVCHRSYEISFEGETTIVRAVPPTKAEERG